MHVLGTPPALVLSQDQTLHRKLSVGTGPTKHLEESRTALFVYDESISGRPGRLGMLRAITQALSPLSSCQRPDLVGRSPYHLRGGGVNPGNPSSPSASPLLGGPAALPGAPVPRGEVNPSTGPAPCQHVRPWKSWRPKGNERSAAEPGPEVPGGPIPRRKRVRSATGSSGPGAPPPRPGRPPSAVPPGARVCSHLAGPRAHGVRGAAPLRPVGEKKEART